ncbi:unnamed protein product [Closterium sp. Naga37s-1]|nr:unnamed protein product [Closterium sp. Naga37s-1]
MSPWEAVEYGLVDGVMGADNPNLVAPVGEVREPPKTKVWDLWTIKEAKERKNLPGEDQLLKKYGGMCGKRRKTRGNSENEEEEAHEEKGEACGWV